MSTYQLEISQPRPYFAELPYYLWGQVNYNSEGDCQTPLDRQWHWLELTHRKTDEYLAIEADSETWTIEGPDESAARLAYFLSVRCDARVLGTLPDVASRDSEPAIARARAVEHTFARSELQPFAVGHEFWGSWKWIGWFGTEYTWAGRWIMDSVLRDDSRATHLCVSWLRQGTYAETQSQALRYALNRFTGQTFATDRDWIDWYFDGPGDREFPEPEFDAWYADMQRIHGGR